MKYKCILFLWTCWWALGACATPPTLIPLHTPPLLTVAPPPTPTHPNTPAPTRPNTPTATATNTPLPTSASTPTAPPSPTPTPSPTLTTTPPPLTASTPVTLYTPDGLSLAAALYAPFGGGPFPAVLLSHMGGADKESWGIVPTRLQAAGYVVLTYDFRGHGQSEGRLDPPSAAVDLNTALAYARSLRFVDGERVALVGASMGGMASVIVGADDPGVRAIAAISSSPEAAGQYPGQVVGQLSPRPFMAIGCDEDPLTLPERVRQLYEAAAPPKQLAILECAAHANDILNTSAAPRLLDLLLRWLNHYVGDTDFNTGHFSHSCLASNHPSTSSGFVVSAQPNG